MDEFEDDLKVPDLRNQTARGVVYAFGLGLVVWVLFGLSLWFLLAHI